MNSLSTVGPNEILLKHYGKRELLRKISPTLEAGMYGITGGKELLAVKGYLYAHGAYQLVAVRCHFGAIILKERQHNWPLAGCIAVILLFMTGHVV